MWNIKCHLRAAVCLEHNVPGSCNWIQCALAGFDYFGFGASENGDYLEPIQPSSKSLHCICWGVNSTSLNWSVFKRIQRYSKILARIKTAKNCWRKFENSADEINLRQLHTMRKLSHLTLTVFHPVKWTNTNTNSNIKTPTPAQTSKVDQHQHPLKNVTKFCLLL